MSLQTRLASLVTAIGADIKRLDDRIDTVSIGGGSDPWSHQALDTVYTISRTTASDVFSGFTPEPNTRYIVDVLLMVSSAASGTGVQCALAGPTAGVNRSAVKIVSASSAVADKIDHLELNTFQTATAGLTKPCLLTIQSILDFAIVGSGNVRVQSKSETNNNTITIWPGSSMRWRTI